MLANILLAQELGIAMRTATHRARQEKKLMFVIHWEGRDRFKVTDEYTSNYLGKAYPGGRVQYSAAGAAILRGE